MTWPQAIVEILGGLGTVIVLLAMFTNFFSEVFGRNRVTVEVLPESVANEFTELVVEMREYVQDGRYSAKQVMAWAKRITEILQEAE